MQSVTLNLHFPEDMRAAAKLLETLAAHHEARMGAGPAPDDSADARPFIDDSADGPFDQSDAAEPGDAAPALDSTGLPWDARIHSGNRALLKDGTWRQRRNLDPADLAAVEAELRAAAKAARATITGAELGDLVAAAFGAAGQLDPAAAFGVTGAADAGVAALAQAAAVATLQGGPVVTAPTAGDVVRKITELKTAGKLPDALLAEILQGVGVTGVSDLMTPSAAEQRAMVAAQLGSLA